MKKIINKVLNFLFNIYICNHLFKHGKRIKIDRHYYSILGLNHISIGDDFFGGPNLILEAIEHYRDFNYNPKIEIGNHTSIGRNSHIGCVNKIIIGNNVMMGCNVLIEDHSHGSSLDFSKPRFELPLISKGEIIIEDNVWICDNSVILSGSHIGKNCVVAANSVVNKEFPDNCLIGGIPAKIIKSSL